MLVGQLKYFRPWWVPHFYDLPKNHIEDIITTQGGEGVSINHNFHGQDFTENITFIHNEPVDYIKIQDDNGNVYYYFNTSTNKAVAEKDGVTYYVQFFVGDEYMTYQQKLLQEVLSGNPNVKFKRKFYDRFDKSSTAYTLNIFKNKHLNLTLDNNQHTYVRKLIASKSGQDVLTDNGYPTTDNITFNRGDNQDTTTVSVDTLNALNRKNRYTYLVCKSSGLQKVASGSQQQSIESDQNKLIIPIIDDTIMVALLNIDYTIAQNPLNAFGDNFIGFLEDDCPPSVGAKKGTPMYAINKTYGGSSINVYFVKFPLNESITVKVKMNNLGSKLDDIVMSLDKGTPDTEPMLLTKAYYKEVYNQGNGPAEFTLEMIDYYNGAQETPAYNFVLTYETEANAVIRFDTINKQNTFYDNTYSVYNSVTSVSDGVWGSANANYYANNATSAITSISTREEEKKMSGMNWGLNTLNSLTGLNSGAFSSSSYDNSSNYITMGTHNYESQGWNVHAWFGERGGLHTKTFPTMSGGQNIGGHASTGFTSGTQKYFNPLQLGLNLASTSLQAIQGALSTQMQNSIRDRQLWSSLNNITSAPSSGAQNPTFKSVLSNEMIGGKSLYTVYALSVHDGDKQHIFNDIINNGYETNEIAPLSTFENRKIMNVLNINTSYMNQHMQMWLGNQAFFQSYYFVNLFIAWLGEPHRIWKTDTLVNCVNYLDDDYVDNIEADYTGFIDINTLVDVQNIGAQFFNVAEGQPLLLQRFLDKNPRLVASGATFFIRQVEYNFFVIGITNTSTYFGNIIAYAYPFYLPAKVNCKVFMVKQKSQNGSVYAFGMLDNNFEMFKEYIRDNNLVYGNVDQLTYGYYDGNHKIRLLYFSYISEPNLYDFDYMIYDCTDNTGIQNGSSFTSRGDIGSRSWTGITCPIISFNSDMQDAFRSWTGCDFSDDSLVSLRMFPVSRGQQIYHNTPNAGVYNYLASFDFIVIRRHSNGKLVPVYSTVFFELDTNSTPNITSNAGNFFTGYYDLNWSTGNGTIARTGVPTSYKRLRFYGNGTNYGTYENQGYYISDARFTPNVAYRIGLISGSNNYLSVLDYNKISGVYTLNSNNNYTLLEDGIYTTAYRVEVGSDLENLDSSALDPTTLVEVPFNPKDATSN